MTQHKAIVITNEINKAKMKATIAFNFFLSKKYNANIAIT
ncbi:Hypothetical cytosolic protein [Lactobacillus helveticus H10]|nr:Hypothetical cytosolic protein [Lactobacillus helveticus H10]